MNDSQNADSKDFLKAPSFVSAQSAKPLCIGSNPIRASNSHKHLQKHPCCISTPSARNRPEFRKSFAARVRKVRLKSGAIAWLADITLAGKRTRKEFPTRELARAEASAMIERARAVGTRAAKLSVRRQIDAIEAIEMLPQGVSLRAAARAYLKHETVKSVPLKTAVEQYIAEKRRMNLRPNSIRDAERRCNHFAKMFRGRFVADVTSKDLRDLLAKYEAMNACNFLRNAKALFSWCVSQGYCKDNPAAKIDLPKHDARPPEIFAPDEAQRLLDATETLYPRLVPYLAIGLFAGLRPTEIESLDWSNIHIAGRAIVVDPAVAKTRRRRIVDMSDNLAAWLEPHAKERGTAGVLWCTIRRHLQTILPVAGIKHWPCDVLRHSFASYHLAIYEDSGKTAMQMGHTGGVGILYRHYRAIVTRSAAVEYWAIRPTTR